MKALLLIATVLATAICCHAATITVNWDGSGDYTTIQAAINDANDFDTVIVADGTYTGNGNRDIDFLGKAITVRSENGPDNCIIDCQYVEDHGGFIFHSGEDAESILNGVTIMRGNIIGNPGRGGGIYCTGSSPTIKNCIITNNKASGSNGSSGNDGKNAFGGGIYCTSDSSPAFFSCTISNNTSEGGRGGDGYPAGGDPPEYVEGGDGGNSCGGGISCRSNSTVTFEQCFITSNTSLGGDGGEGVEYSSYDGNGGCSWGGGIYSSSDSTIIMNYCKVSGNASLGGNNAFYPSCLIEAYGGGIAGGSMTINDCIISENQVAHGEHGLCADKNYGGGIYCNSGTLSVRNCLIVGNEAYYGFDGGTAIYSSGSNVTISNCTIIYNYSDYSGSGSAIYGGTGTITNCILWGNNTDDDVSGGGLTATYSCTEQIISGTGNIHTDPNFAIGLLGDYYLSQTAAGQDSNSPCVNAGSDTSTNLRMDEYTTRTDQVADVGVVDMGYHYDIQEIPVSLSFVSEVYAYSDAFIMVMGMEDEDSDEAWDTSQVVTQAVAHVFFEDPCIPVPPYYYSEEMEHESNTQVVLDTTHADETVSLLSNIKGWGQWWFEICWGQDCDFDSGTDSGTIRGQASLVGTAKIGTFEGFPAGSSGLTLKMNAQISGNSPGSWDTWDWWLKIWDDDPCNPLAVLDDANKSVGSPVITGQVLNIGFYHEAEGWTGSVLDSTVTVDLEVCIPGPADINSNGDVGMGDLLIVALQWLQAPDVPSADIAPDPLDNFVDYQDFATVEQRWQTCTE